MATAPILVLWSLAALGGAGAGPAPDADREFAVIQKLFAARDLIGLQRLMLFEGGRRIEKLPTAVRNRVALLAAQNLEIRSYLQGIEYGDFHALLRDPAHPDINRQWGINTVASDILRQLSEKRLITERRIIPYLLETLDYPTVELKRSAYYTLRFLTGRAVGEDVWGHGVSDAVKEPVYRTWWRQWWQANKDRHPLYTEALQRKVQRRVEAIYADVQARVAPQIAEMSWMTSFHYRPYHHPTGRVVGEFAYTPGLLALTAVPAGKPPVPFERMPGLWVEARFLTPGPKGIPDDDRPAAGRGKARLVHREILVGTGIEVRVLLATPSADLERALRALLGPAGKGSD